MIKISKISVVAIGDSITAGYPYWPEKSWFNLIAEQLGFTYSNKGVNGDTTSGMLHRFYNDVVLQQPAYTIIMGGTNDAYDNIEVKQVFNNIKEMVQLACTNRIIPLLGLPIPCNDLSAELKLKQYRQSIQQYAVAADVVCIDFQQAFISEDDRQIKNDLLCDGLHPSENGYKVMAGAVGVILSELAIL